MNNMSVTAVIVTYNRLNLLKKSIKKVLNQTSSVTHIIIVNNNSTDDTEQYLKELSYDSRIIVVNLSVNTGGAGGFYSGIEKAYEIGDDFIWLMDDDTMPNNNALERLLGASLVLNNNFGFLCSNVRWKDGSPALMNVPKPQHEWSNFSDKGLVGLITGSFVSMIIPRTVVEKVGLPIKEFFIWGDDLEYSERISKIAPSYFVSDSIIIHEMASNRPVSIVDDSRERLSRYYCNQRNLFYISKKRGKKELFKYCIRTICDTISVLTRAKDSKWLRIKNIWAGFISGIFFHPNIRNVEN